jgi:hypothetical protein
MMACTQEAVAVVFSSAGVLVQPFGALADLAALVRSVLGLRASAVPKVEPDVPGWVQELVESGRAEPLRELILPVVGARTVAALHRAVPRVEAALAAGKFDEILVAGPRVAVKHGMRAVLGASLDGLLSEMETSAIRLRPAGRWYAEGCIELLRRLTAVAKRAEPDGREACRVAEGPPRELLEHLRRWSLFALLLVTAVVRPPRRARVAEELLRYCHRIGMGGAVELAGWTYGMDAGLVEQVKALERWATGRLFLHDALDLGRSLRPGHYRAIRQVAGGFAVLPRG